MPDKCVYEYPRADNQRGCRFKPGSDDLCDQIDPINPENCPIIIRIKEHNSLVKQGENCPINTGKPFLETASGDFSGRQKTNPYKKDDGYVSPYRKD
jgi:hypothetical protein